jgi:hypothetical protein
MHPLSKFSSCRTTHYQIKGGADDRSESAASARHFTTYQYSGPQYHNNYTHDDFRQHLDVVQLAQR